MSSAPRASQAGPFARGRAAAVPAFALLALALLGACGEGERAEVRPLGDVNEGRAIVGRVGCGACHVIPGVPGARGSVGPSLEGFAARGYIGGVQPNTPAVLVAWLRDPPAFSPRTAMPPQPLDEREALQVAAFLYTLK